MHSRRPILRDRKQRGHRWFHEGVMSHQDASSWLRIPVQQTLWEKRHKRTGSLGDSISALRHTILSRDQRDCWQSNSLPEFYEISCAQECCHVQTQLVCLLAPQVVPIEHDWLVVVTHSFGSKARSLNACHFSKVWSSLSVRKFLQCSLCSLNPS